MTPQQMGITLTFFLAGGAILYAPPLAPTSVVPVGKASSKDVLPTTPSLPKRGDNFPGDDNGGGGPDVPDEPFCPDGYRDCPSPPAHWGRRSTRNINQVSPRMFTIG